MPVVEEGGALLPSSLFDSSSTELLGPGINIKHHGFRLKAVHAAPLPQHSVLYYPQSTSEGRLQKPLVRARLATITALLCTVPSDSKKIQKTEGVLVTEARVKP